MSLAPAVEQLPAAVVPPVTSAQEAGQQPAFHFNPNGPVANAAPVAPTAPAAQEAPAAPSMRSELESVGFTIPSELQTNKEVIDFLAVQIDEANAVAESRPAPGMTGQPPASQQSAASPSPGTAAAVADVPATTSLNFNVSPEAQRLVDAQVIVKTPEGAWASTVPGIPEAYTAEMNTQEAMKVRNARRVTENPLDFVKDAAAQLGLADKTVVDGLKAEIDAMKNERQAANTAVAEGKVDAWVVKNAAAIFLGGNPDSGHTPYGQRFLDMEYNVKSWSKGEQLTRPELHRRTLKMMTDLGITPESMGAAVQPAQPVDQSFMGQAPAPQPGVRNNLQDYAAVAPPSAPKLHLGKGGYPSLMHHIQANPNQLS